MGDVVLARRLPSKPQDLARYIVVASGVLAAKRAELKVIHRIHGDYRQKLHEAQELAELVLGAQQHLEEYLADLDLSYSHSIADTPYLVP